MGETDETLTLHITGKSSGLNSLYARHGIGENKVVVTELVDIRTLDGYCRELRISKIDFMKVDVEGHELSVLKGARELLAAGNISMIQFEYGGCNLDSRIYLGDIWHFLSGYEYRIGKVYPNGIHYINEYKQQFETFKYSNWVAVYGNGRG